MQKQENINEFEILRIEYNQCYSYILATKDDKYYTISKIDDDEFFTIQELETFNPNIPLEQSFNDFIDNHAVIHIKPKKYIWNWRD